MKAKRILALLLALALCVSLFAACGGDSGNSSSGSGDGGTASTSEGGDAEPAGSGITFPLEEPATLTIWRTAATSDPKLGIVTYNDIEMVQKWEEATNVHIEWDIPPSGQEREQFNLMVTSGVYPDIIFDANQYYTGGLDKAIADDVVIPLNDLLDTYGPDYKKLISSDPLVLKDCTTDEGNIAAVFLINYPDQGPWYGLTVRNDWLEACNLDVPVTYDDWHDMLVAFKDQMGATNPLWLNNRGSDMFNIFTAGFGVATLGNGSTAAFYNDNGTAKYGPLEPGYKDYVTTMAQWYSEGLIDPDFYTRTTDVFVPDDLSGTGACGAFADIYTLIDLRPVTSIDTTIDTIPVPQPVMKEGDTVHLRQYNFTRGTSGASISTACKNPELAMAWMNLGSIEEYSLLAYWGVEGDTYTMENGEPQFTDKILNNEEFTPNDAVTKYLWRAPGMYRWSRELQFAGPKAVDAIDNVWVQHSDGAWYMPNITMTTEEGNEFSRIMGDVDTYASEMTTKFILGQESLDNYDSFVETLRGMGAESALALQQAALDRFNAR